MDFALSGRQQEWHDAAVRFAQTELVDDLLGRDERREFWREGWRRCAGSASRGCRSRPSTAGGARPARHDRGDGGARLRLPGQRPDLRDQRLDLDQLDPDPPLRHRGAEAALPAGPLRRPTRRRQRRQRARGGLRHLQHADPRRASRRRLGPQRPQDLGDQRPGGRPLRLLRDDRPGQGASWASRRLPRPARHARLPGRARDPQARRPHGADGRAGPRGLRAARRRPARPRGAGGRGLQLLDGVGAGGDPGRHAGDDAPAARALHRARPPPQAVRPADRQVPVGRQQDRRHEAAPGDLPPPGLQDRLAQGAGARTRRSRRRWPSCTSRSASSRTASTPCSSSAPRATSTETGIERDLRDSVGSTIYSGTNDIQRNIIARHLRL